MKKCATWWHSIFMSIRESCLLEMSQPSVMRHRGISYAYSRSFPIWYLLYLWGSPGLFHASADGLLHAARMADVLFVTGAVYFVVKACKSFSERGKMAVCRTGRLYAAGIVSGNLCKHGFPGAFIHGDHPVFLVLLYWKRETEAPEIRSFWLLK